MDFFSMDLNTLPRNASSPLKFSSITPMSCPCALTLHVNLGLSLRKTSQALKDLYNISISHQQIANYCKTAATCVSPLLTSTPTKKGTCSRLMLDIHQNPWHQKLRLAHHERCNTLHHRLSGV